MSTAGDGPRRYGVTYSARMRAALLELSDAARKRGDGAAYATAVQEFDRRLRVYPQFGDPLIDLHQQSGQIRLGIVPPLAMRYGVLEDLGLVFVAAMPVLMPRSDV